ncbi:glycosyltransferase family 2 protein [uncultured Subdoligranulum sp.]|uniref:glycosyltransferase family 2 protein n=1 Tax=uncultured Subdoligranulum sp. TaxID=512298 RepID=UPI0025F0EAF9|nr:glycosyltransferase family 2 protein [uncultured Subdoligranulum sp.]
MLLGKTVAVTVPAYNEETQISMVIESMPDFVDRIVIVNDGSKDDTSKVVKEHIAAAPQSTVCIPKLQFDSTSTIYNRADLALLEMRKQEEAYFPTHTVINDNDHDRIVLIEEVNSGVGAAIAVGYKWCRDHGIDCTAVMAGDGQMDPAELESIVTPVIRDGIDYVKGNRLSHPAAKIIVPQIRYLGNNILSLLTKIASGYWSVSDTQTGYTAISLSALNRIDLHNIYHSYGCPNDILVKLNIANCTLMEVPIKPVYNVGEKSKMKLLKVVPSISWLLIRSFFRRLWTKYLVDSFHPLFLFYSLGIIMALVNIPFLLKLVVDVLILNGSVTMGWYITFLLLTLFSYQSISFAMWMDMQDNSKLEKTHK